MIEELKTIKSDKSDLKKFGFTVGIILLIIAGVLFWKEKESFKILFIFGLTLIIFGTALPVVLKPIYLVWMIFATILGWVMTRIILSLLYYVVITPIGIFARLFGKQFLELKWNKKERTYWKYRSKSKVEEENYEYQF